MPSPLSIPASLEDPESEALMLLMNRCVDALHLMQERMAGIEDHARRTGEVVIRDQTEIRTDLSGLRTRLKLAESSVEQMSIHMSSYAPDLDGSEHPAGIMALIERADVSDARLNDVEDRLASVETGLGQRLEQTEADLAAADATVTELRLRAEDGEATSATLQRKLMEATQAMVEQRARIACLQAKLIAATDVRTLGEATAALHQHSAGPAETRDVIDLTTLDERRTSAA